MQLVGGCGGDVLLKRETNIHQTEKKQLPPQTRSFLLRSCTAKQVNAEDY